MKQPSLTPYSTSMEEAIQRMVASLEENARDPQYDAVAVRTAISCLPAMLRSFGGELDMRVKPSDIIEGFACTIANFMGSLISTLVEKEGREACAFYMIQQIAMNLNGRLDPDGLPDNAHTKIDFRHGPEGTA